MLVIHTSSIAANTQGKIMGFMDVAKSSGDAAIEAAKTLRTKAGGLGGDVKEKASKVIADINNVGIKTAVSQLRTILEATISEFSNNPINDLPATVRASVDVFGTLLEVQIILPSNKHHSESEELTQVTTS